MRAAWRLATANLVDAADGNDGSSQVSRRPADAAPRAREQRELEASGV